ncbi:glycoside hydrolase family 3 C-terminal domain-containing protein [Streptomyces sp. NBC_00576]|uniref:glycoside hydrolase family 3 C-terminal domain-containing protein n=1 Tax=Streptomyces sp. NBC_00576 TaxID=2903665 RepID=UPI002E81C7D8|nr:glycoside hydrolase family 3 C-terminal domain-containing protein [Streptomyces sp. NBC_00576]WUB76751.1 glycoside hydrolase family 3 C-terminal domain-containing protein [Streptomyces sp. NBC_00576]
MGSPSLSAAHRVPFRDPALPVDKRVDDLLGRLTLDERTALLHQYAPAVERLGIASFRTGTEALHGVSWLGEATVFPQAVGLGATWDENLVREVAEAVSVELRAFHQHRPTANGIGVNSLQAWAPVVNLLRDPRWGRNEEGYSEDPVHTARLGIAYCQGLAGDHPDFLRAAPVLKHFLAYNNENDRCVTSSGLRPRVLHEYDLAAFRPIIASGAATGAMAAYNLVNGRPCHVSPLIEDELRRWARQAGHELFVVSDEEAPCNLVELEHYFEDHATSHAAALKAGIDSFTDHREDSATVIGRLREALERGLIEEEDVNRAVRRQLQLRFRLGEFDPELDPYAGTGPEVIDSAEHRALALRAATESVVLLKNDGLLPLRADRAPRIAVIGPHADALYEDWYSGTLPYRVGIASGLRAAAGDVVAVEAADRIALRSHTTGEPLGNAAYDVTEWGDGVLTLRDADTGRYLTRKDDDSLVADHEMIKTWFVNETFLLETDPFGDADTVLLRNVFTGRYAVVDPDDGRVTTTADSPQKAERWHRELLRDGHADARSAAAAADIAIVVLGNHPLINGRETEDRTGTALPATQEALLREVAAVRPETALVVMSSYPYALDWADEHLPAVVWTSHGGQETGRALAAVLLGEVDASGRLPQTWYLGDDELPHPLDYDIIKAGWTYQYHRGAPLYPFGHGLSYAEFDYGDLRLSTPTVSQDGTLDVSVTLSNTGARPGTEVVQLYVRAVDARYEAPRLKLADFRKVPLEPGQSREVDFRLSAEQLAHWDVTTGAFTVDPGAYEVLVARSAEHIVEAAPLTVTGTAPAPRVVAGRRIRAADFDDCTDVTLVDATRAAGDAVTPTDPTRPATLLFQSVDLSGVTRVEAEVARESAGSGEARLEVRFGDRLLAELAPPVTGSRYTWTTATADTTPSADGIHDLRLTLHGDFRLATFSFGASENGTA